MTLPRNHRFNSSSRNKTQNSVLAASLLLPQPNVKTRPRGGFLRFDDGRSYIEPTVRTKDASPQVNTRSATRPQGKTLSL